MRRQQSEEITWEDFFEKFEERGLALVYQTEDGGWQKEQLQQADRARRRRSNKQKPLASRLDAAERTIEIEGRTLALSNLDKVLYPGNPFTKAHVIDYYARVSKWLLPHLHNRPVTLKRFPDGVNGKAFYEKDAPRYTPDWVTIAPVPRRYGGSDIRYILIDDLPTLIWCANIASLELHPFLHSRRPLDKPGSIVFDLDPGEGATSVTCAEVAVLLRKPGSMRRTNSLSRRCRGQRASRSISR